MRKRQVKKEANWRSYSDIMTGLMVIFLFVSISYMLKVNEQKAAVAHVFEKYMATKKELHHEMDSTFRDNFDNWQLELGEDLSLKFTNPDVLFQSGKSTIRPKFAKILEEFLPKYFGILLQEKYAGKISEIRIEGHTDMVPVSSIGIPYIGNLELSQQRSSSVMDFFIRSNYYKNLNEEKRWWLLFHLTANGLSYGRTLDKDKNLTFHSKKTINNDFSRRVEFKVVTNTASVVKNAFENL